MYDTTSNKVFHLFLFLVLFLCSPGIFSQSANDTIDKVYGFDPLLYNGKIYYFFPQPGTGGTQYLNKEFDIQGKITLRGDTYDNQVLNYDVFNQQLVLKYRNSVGSSSLIEISNAWLEKFELDGCHFELITEADTSKRIYQVLGTSTERILYYRSKELLLDNMKSTRSRYFTEAKKEMFVQKNNSILSFKNNRGFIKIFEPARQEVIKKYMRLHKIKVQRASDSLMNDLINYCFSLKES